LKKFVIEPRRSLRGSSETADLSTGDPGATALSVVIVGSSVVDVRGDPELPRRTLSKEPSTPFLGLVGEPAVGGEELPSEIPPVLAKRVRSANSGPMGASSGLELRSVPRVRPIPALDDDIRRKSIGLASGEMWLELVGWELLEGLRVAWMDGAGALL
jgi:hypothetical protein